MTRLRRECGPWLRNTDGHKDATFTVALLSWVAVIVLLCLHRISDGAIAALLAPTWTAYVARRYTTAVVEPGAAPPLPLPLPPSDAGSKR